MKKINILLVFCLLTNLFVFQSCQKKDSHIEIASIPVRYVTIYDYDKLAFEYV